MLQVYRPFSLVAIGGLLLRGIDLHAVELPVVPTRVATPPESAR
jgi:hypothetical protein